MINILNIDTQKIFDELYKKESEMGIQPYFICSKDTMRLIISQSTVLGTEDDVKQFKAEGYLVKYCGYKTLIDDSLK